MGKRNLKTIHRFIILRGYYMKDDSCFLILCKDKSSGPDLPSNTGKNFLALDLKQSGL